MRILAYLPRFTLALFLYGASVALLACDSRSAADVERERALKDLERKERESRLMPSIEAGRTILWDEVVLTLCSFADLEGHSKGGPDHTGTDRGTATLYFLSNSLGILYQPTQYPQKAEETRLLAREVALRVAAVVKEDSGKVVARVVLDTDRQVSEDLVSLLEAEFAKLGVAPTQKAKP